MVTRRSCRVFTQEEVEMATDETVATCPRIEQFTLAQGWKITGWKVSPDGGIPPNGFAVKGTLLIGIAQSTASACDLNWLNSAGEQCSITKLPFRDGELGAGIFPVRFGGSTVDCYIEISPEKYPPPARRPGKGA